MKILEFITFLKPQSLIFKPKEY